MTKTITSAHTLERAAMHELFNEGFSGYLVPMRLDDAAFSTYLEHNDIDLDVSRVMVDERPASFALVGVRRDEVWIGGMGTVPAARRQGYGQLVLESALDAARAIGGRLAWLEVIDANRAALTLYDKLGFGVTRELLVWELPASTQTGNGGEVDVRQAWSWIAANRQGREPWQRADEVLTKLTHGELRAVGIEQDGELAGAAIFRSTRDRVSVMQIAAADEQVAAGLLCSAASGGPLRFANVPANEPSSTAMRKLGAKVVARQHEMRLAL